MNKDELKKARKEAYQKAKKARDENPDFIALKEKAKQSRRAAYKAYKDALKAQKEKERLERINAKDQELAQISGLGPQLKLLSFEK